jgi:hypothetical protein
MVIMGPMLMLEWVLVLLLAAVVLTNVAERTARTVALQPLSLEGSIGLNVALGVSMLKLRAV